MLSLDVFEHPERPERLIDLGSNENPFGASALVQRAILGAAADCHRYPERGAEGLRQRLATTHGLSVEEVMVGPGSTALIDLVARARLARGGNAVLPALSFVSVAASVRAAGGGLRLAPMQGHSIDLDRMRSLIDRDTRLVYLPNPNNPTGAAHPREAVEAFLDSLPDDVLVLFDEAYQEYAQAFADAEGWSLPDGPTLVRQERNLLALRTFSKVHGLAGLRVGYALGSAPLLRSLSAQATPFPVGRLATAAALAALADPQHVALSAQRNRWGLRQLRRGLQAIGLEPAPSVANFLYVPLGALAAPVVTALLHRGVRVRCLDAWGAPDALRVAVGSPEDNARFLGLLAALLAAR